MHGHAVSSLLREMPTAKRVRVDGGRHLTRGSDPSSFDDGLRCANCRQCIPFLSEYAQLSPCTASVCLRCLAALHARRGAQLLRFCGVKVSSNRIIGAERIPTDETVSFNVDEGETLTDEQMQEQRPLDFLLEREYEEFNNSSGEGMMAVLYCGMVERTREKTEVIYKSSHIKRFYNKPPSPEYSESVATFFSFLGPQITLLSATPYSDMVKFSPPDFSKHAVKNYTPLMAALSDKVYAGVLHRYSI